MLLSVSVLILVLGFGEAKKQGIYLDADERPMCPCDPILPRIAGGQDVDNATFPYASYIVVGNLLSTCGATLISDRHVITSAQCLDKLGPIAGPYRTDQVQVHIGHYDHRIGPKNLCQSKSVVIYRLYNPDTFDHDIALVEFDKKKKKCGPKMWRHRMLTAVLPEIGLRLEPGTVVSAYGWGRLDNDHTYPSVLQSVEMTVMGNQRCQEKFYGPYKKDDTFCVEGEEGKGACKGDSGGGLVVRLGNNYVLCGVMSFGKQNCPKYNAPAVYTRVSSYVDWIYKNTMSSGCRPCISES